MDWDEIFERASHMLESAETENDCIRAEELFKSILGRQDAGAMVAACRVKAEQLKNRQKQNK